MRVITCIIFCCFFGSAYSQQKVDKDYVGLQVMQGNEYTLLILRNTGNPFPKDSIDGWRMQHLQNLFQMHVDKKTSVFGPVMEPGSDISGIIIFNTTDTMKVKQWMSGDPFIKNKIFIYQLYNWFGIPDQKLLPSGSKKN